MGNSKKTIYVVDDDDDVNFAIIDGLRVMNPNFDFIKANSAVECLLKINTYSKPDLVIMDIMLPDINGIDLADRVRKIEGMRKVPILFLTARIDEKTKKDAKFYSRYFLNKPFDMDELNKQVNKAL